MGPQLDSCGRSLSSGLKTSLTRLQWGRTLTVAEGAGVGGRSAMRALLQWGRNLTVAEGAGQPLRRSEWQPLQWGRNLTVAEGAVVVAELYQLAGFNGAAT